MAGEETPFTPYQIQRALGVPVDGKWGPVTERAARAFLKDPKDNTGRPWTPKRLIVGVQQKLMADAGIPVTVDGLPGVETFSAFDKWRAMEAPKDPVVQASAEGDVPPAPYVIEAGMLDFSLIKRFWDWLREDEKTDPAPVVIEPAKPEKPAETEPVRTVEGKTEQVVIKPATPAKPAILQPTVWPRQKDVTSFYGQHGKVPLVRVACPWQMELSWEPKTKVNSIVIHEKVAKSLERVLRAQFEHYGLDGLRNLGVHKYGGSYNDRKMRGSNAWSMHAYGIAIDFDPDCNQLKWDHTRARLAKADAEMWWKIWEKEGWVSLGRERDYDWMHVQAARL